MIFAGKWRWAALFALMAVACQRSLQKSALLVFAAASTADAMTEIASRALEAKGIAVEFSFGGSRDLARQIEAGAKANMLVSADVATIDRLAARGLVGPHDRVKLMSNRLVVIVPLEKASTAADWRNAKKVAVADPESAPAGAYAKAWLERAELWASMRDRLVPTLDVRAALAAVEAARADAGIVYRTDAAASKRVHVAYEVPEQDAPAVVYEAALIAKNPHPDASPFLGLLTDSESRRVFVAHGFVW